MRRNKLKYRLFKRFDALALVLPLSLVAVWCLASYVIMLPPYLLPRPDQVLVGLLDFVIGKWKLSPYSGRFVSHTLASLSRVIQGFLIALAVGLPLGIWSGSVTRAKRVFDPFVDLLRMVPGIGWLPIAMVWFGVGHVSAVFLIALASFFPIYINTALGVRIIPLNLIQAARSLGATGSFLFFHVIIPAASPGILSGMRLGLGISWAYVVLGELTGVNEGLGAVMMNARMLGDTNMILVCMIVIALLGRLTDRLLVLLSKTIHIAGEVRPND